MPQTELIEKLKGKIRIAGNKTTPDIQALFSLEMLLITLDKLNTETNGNFTDERLKSELISFYNAIKHNRAILLQETKTEIFDCLQTYLSTINKLSSYIQTIINIGFSIPLTFDITSFRIISTLGAGNFGKVVRYKVVDSQILLKLRDLELIADDDDTIAVKYISAETPENLAAFNLEAEIATSLFLSSHNRIQIGLEKKSSNTNSIDYYNYSIAAMLDNKLAIFCRYETGGSGLDFVKKWHERDIKQGHSLSGIKDSLLAVLILIWNIWQGLIQLHRAGVIHGDLHLGNILIQNTPELKQKFIAKITDFGLSKLYQIKYPDLPLQANALCQIRRVNIERSTYHQLTIATDLQSFKMLIMEVIATMAGLDFEKLLQETITDEVLDDYSIKNKNDQMLKLVKDKLEKSLRDYSPTHPIYLALIKMLSQFKHFISSEDDLLPSEQMSNSADKLQKAMHKCYNLLHTTAMTSMIAFVVAKSRKVDLSNTNNNTGTQPNSNSYTSHEHFNSCIKNQKILQSYMASENNSQQPLVNTLPSTANVDNHQSNMNSKTVAQNSYFSPPHPSASRVKKTSNSEERIEIFHSNSNNFGINGTDELPTIDQAQISTEFTSRVISILEHHNNDSQTFDKTNPNLARADSLFFSSTGFKNNNNNNNNNNNGTNNNSNSNSNNSNNKCSATLTAAKNLTQ